MPSNFDYFLIFFRRKILDGEKQIDIANSPLVDKSPAYINNLYKGNPKSCPIKTQKSIAQYFNISYEEMIEEGKKMYLKSFPSTEGDNQRVTKQENYFDDFYPTSERLLKHLDMVASGIKLQAEYLSNYLNYRKKTELYNLIFENIDEEVTFFNVNGEFVFSTNIHGILHDVDLLKKSSYRDILFSLEKNLSPDKEKIISVFEDVYSKKSRESLEIYYKEIEYLLRLRPVYEKDVFLGIVVVTTLKKIRSNY